MSHVESGTTDMKHIQQEFSSKAWVRPLVGCETQIQDFQNMVKLNIIFKEMTHAATW